MGLDLVELVMRVEEEFSVEISDAEASKATTVGALHKLLVKKLDPAEPRTCMTSAAFYRTRKALMEAVGVPRNSIRPFTPLGELFADADRVSRWSAFRNAMKLQTPDIETGWLLRGSIYPVGTVGDFARRVASLNDAELRKQCGGWNEKEIWENLRRIVVHELGVELDAVTKEARFVEDLKVD